MNSVKLKTLVGYCDDLLQTRVINDYDGAHNGLQVENRGGVTRIAATVDASLATVRLAIAAGADLLIVHHGLFWAPRHPWTGRHHELLRLLLEHDVAVYSSHLPLDLHPQLGNNVQLAAALGWKRRKPFFFEKRNPGRGLGFQTVMPIGRAELVTRLRRAVGGGEVNVLPGGPATCRRLGVVTGGAGGELQLAAQEGVDTFITGEGPHWTFALAEELGLNVLYAGHYATETFGVKALAQHLSGRFRVPWGFLDHPTGL